MAKGIIKAKKPIISNTPFTNSVAGLAILNTI